MPGACAAGNNDHNTSMSKRQLAIALWTVGILNFATNLAPLIQYQGYDTVPIWRAVHGLLNHSQIYTHGGAGDFLYFPSALLMLLPLGAVSLPLAKAGLFFVDIGAILVSTAMLLRLFGYRWFGLAGAIALCGVSFAYPVFFTVGAGNVDALVLVGFAGFLLAASSGRGPQRGLPSGWRSR
jgi:Glycosyltransferase family 87